MFLKWKRCVPKAMNKANENTRHLTSCGYIAYIPQLSKYILFPTEMEYLEYVSEVENEM